MKTIENYPEGLECTLPVNLLAERLRFIEENASHLQDIIKGFEECLERLTGPEPQEVCTDEDSKQTECIFERLDVAQKTYGKIVAELVTLMVRFQQSI